MQDQDMNLKQLFTQVDRIGKQYLTQEEINAYNKAMAEVRSEIEKELDQEASFILGSLNVD